MCLRATTGLLLICMAAALYQTGPVQAIEKPLTNTDVAKMLKAGLAEHTITFAIQLAIERGNADFDSAPEALIELKNTGATEEILNAILYASTLPPRYVPSKTVLGLPEHPGLYHQAEAGWTALDQVLLWPEIRTTWTWRTASDHRRWRTSPAADHRVEAVVLPARSQSRARMGAAAVDRAEGSPRVANHDSRRVLVLAPRGVRGGRTPRSRGRCTRGGCAEVAPSL